MASSDVLQIRNWEKWQSYRRDRGQPPWIKVHREVMRNPDWVMLTDAQRGQLVGMWLLAADRDGVIPASPKLIQKLCYMDSEPDLQLFVRLGFVEPDANVTPERRQSDHTEAETEAEEEAETEPTPSPRTREAMGDVENSEPDKLSEWLNGHASALDDFALYRDRRLRNTLFQHYGPPGLRANAWKRPDGTSVPPDERPRVFVVAASGYGAEGKRTLIPNEFAGCLRATVKAESGEPAGSQPHQPMTDEEFDRWLARKDKLVDGGMDPEDAAEQAMSEIRGEAA